MNRLSTRQFRKEDAERLLDFISSCSTKPFVEIFEDFILKRDKHLEERGLKEGTVVTELEDKIVAVIYWYILSDFGDDIARAFIFASQPQGNNVVQCLKEVTEKLVDKGVKTLLVSFLDETLGRAMNLEKYKEIVMRKSLDSIPKEPSVSFTCFRVIKATHSDVERVCKAVNRMRSTRMETLFQPDWIRKRMKHRACLIAEVNSKIVGSVWLDRRTAEICDIRVHPEYRAQGIGKALMFHALKYFKRQKRREVRLSVSPQNKLAFNWYLRLGFEIVGDKPIPRRYIIKIVRVGNEIFCTAPHSR